jgi:hypothetical protein
MPTIRHSPTQLFVWVHFVLKFLFSPSAPHFIKAKQSQSLLKVLLAPYTIFFCATPSTYYIYISVRCSKRNCICRSSAKRVFYFTNVFYLHVLI